MGLCFFPCGLGVPGIAYKVDLKPKVIPWPLPKEVFRGRTWILLQKQFLGEEEPGDLSSLRGLACLGEAGGCW